MGAIQGPDNRPQQDTTGVNRVNGEVLTDNAKQFAENARNMIIEALAKLKTPVKPETEAEARENARLSDEEKLPLLEKILEIYVLNKDSELCKERIKEFEIEIAELKTRIEARENLKKALEDKNNEELPVEPKFLEE